MCGVPSAHTLSRTPWCAVGLLLLAGALRLVACASTGFDVCCCHRLGRLLQPTCAFSKPSTPKPLLRPSSGTGHPPFCFESIVLRLLARHCSCRYLCRRATSRRLGSSSPSCRSTTRSQMIRRTGLSSDSVSERSLELTHPCPCVLQYAAAAPA